MKKADLVNKLIANYIDSWNSHDATAVASCFTPDGVYEDYFVRKKYQGNDIQKHIQSVFDHGIDLTFKILGDATVVTGNKVAVQVLTSGIRPLDNTYFEVESGEFYEIDDGKIKSLKKYYEGSVDYTSDVTAEVIKGYMNCWNRHDIEGLTAFFTDDAVYEDGVRRETHCGDGIKKYIEDVYKEGNALSFELISDITRIGYGVVIQTLMSGYSRLNGSYFEIENVEFHEIIGRKIKSIKVYYDNSMFENLPGGQQVISLLPEQSELALSKKYERSSLNEKKQIVYRKQLLVKMESEKLFQNNEITMPILADIMGISTNHLSQVINGQLGMNFFDFINTYRIKEAKQLLINLEGKAPDSILDIALMVGFNTTSTFYNAFKKFSGISPVKFRKLNR
jgi:uncharacterized protein (TIGR02246 family)